LELYQHACHELKRYTKEGKQMVAELEAETARDTPPLMLAYLNASPTRMAELDVTMRDMKTNARLRSKEMWYAWRSQLLDELMGGLQSIGENLIKDDEVLTKSETLIQRTLPPLEARHAALYQESIALESKVHAISEEAEEEVQLTRDAIVNLTTSLAEKQRILDELRQRASSEDESISNLHAAKTECLDTTRELKRLQESCRSVSVDEVAALQGRSRLLYDPWTHFTDQI
jgi:kinetochore protein Spc7/SPC105